MAAYLIVNYTVTDSEEYAAYQKGAVPALKVGSECEIVVYETETETVEGKGAGRQTVVLKFESKEKAREVYESSAYQAVLGKRLAATTDHFAVLVNTMG